VGLSMAERKAVTKQMARRYARAAKKEKGRMLDELCPSPGGPVPTRSGSTQRRSPLRNDPPGHRDLGSTARRSWSR
jgi:hypothetical protein